MRILVVGGAWAAQRVARILAREPGRKVDVAGQGSVPPLVLEEPGSFQALTDYDCLVCCPDAAGSPEQVVRYCQERGLLCLHMGAQPDWMERLLLERRRGQGAKALGTVLLGVGVTPGLTNLMAHELSRGRQAPRRLEVGLRFTGWAGLVPGLFSLLVHPLLPGSAYYSQGDRLDALGIGPGVRFPFAKGESDTVHVALPEAIMLHWSTGVQATATYLALPSPWLPSSVGRAARLATLAVPRWLTLPSLVHQGLRGVSGSLAMLPVPLEVTALADREGVVRCSGDWISVKVDDHAEASAAIVSAALKLLGDRRRAGVFLPDEVFSFEEVLAQVRALEGNTVDIVVHRGASSPVSWPSFAKDAGSEQAPLRRVASGD